MTFGEKVIEFNRNLSFEGTLPPAFKLMNPFEENMETIRLMERFCNKVYADTNERVMILGKNPGHYGVGDTGVPLTDTRLLASMFGIRAKSFVEVEPSSDFFYDMINRYCGVRKFYRYFYVGSVCPIGLRKQAVSKNWLHCDYYDRAKFVKGFPLMDSLYDFIVASLKKQIAFGINTDYCYAIGKDNARRLRVVNGKEKLFGAIITLTDPRYAIHSNREADISGYIDSLAKED